MFTKSKFCIIVFLFILFFSFSVYASSPEVAVSVYPVYEVVNSIGEDVVEIELIVPSGAELHSYEPSIREIASLENVDIFFYIGLGLEPWVDRAVDNLQERGVKTVRMTEGLELREYGEEHDCDHHHEDCQEEHHGHHEHNDHNNGEQVHDHGHDHGKYDPHVWLDPLLMKSMGEIVAEELIELYPEKEEKLRENFNDFSHRLNRLDKNYSEGLVDIDSEMIIVSHAAFGYLARRYGFQQKAVTGVSPHAEPSPAAIAELAELVEEYSLKYIYQEKLAAPRSVEVLAEETDLEVLILDPLAGLTPEEQEEGEDYFSIMKNNLEMLQRGLNNE